MLDLLHLEDVSIELSSRLCVLGKEPDRGKFAFSVEHALNARRVSN